MSEQKQNQNPKTKPRFPTTPEQVNSGLVEMAKRMMNLKTRLKVNVVNYQAALSVLVCWVQRLQYLVALLD